MSVHNALLTLVSPQPAGVYRLKRMFKDQTCGVWPLSIGQAYQAMRRLEHTGCITSHQETNAGRDSGIFEITDAGRAILDEWWSAPAIRKQSEHDELVMKLTVAAADPDVGTAPLTQMQRRATRAVLREATRINESADDGELTWKLILESHIFKPEAESK